jgi:hypothetical protein
VAASVAAASAVGREGQEAASNVSYPAFLFN